MAGAVHGEDRSPTLAQLHHTRWTTEDGAPGDVWALAQTPDGWLWLGAPTGLYRFDGIQFERIEIEGLAPERSRAVSALYAADSGELWIGYMYGGASRLVNGRFTHFSENAGMGGGTLVSFAQDRSGALWAASADALCKLHAEQWQKVGTDWNFPDRYANAIAVDQRGTLWVAGAHQLLSLEPGASRFQATGLKVTEHAELLQFPDGRTWLADDEGVRVLPRQEEMAPRSEFVNARASAVTLVDRTSHLWWLADRVRRKLAQEPATLRKDPGLSESFSKADGLTDDVTKAILEDREGNIWISTSLGLDRFRSTNVRKLAAPVSDLGSYALAPGPNGSVWIGTKYGGSPSKQDGLWSFDGTLHRIDEGRITAVTAAARDDAGTLFVAGPDGLWRQRSEGGFIRLTDLPEDARGQDVHALTVDAQGAVWVSIVRSRLYRWHNGAWQLNGGLIGLPDARPQAHARDARNRLWFGYRNGTIAIVDGDRVEILDAKSGLQFGAIFAISAGRYSIVAGEGKVAALHDGRFQVVSTIDPTVLEGVTGIVESADAIWLSGFRGAVRIEVRDLDAALTDRGRQLPYELFDAEDGFPGMAQRVRPLPTAIQGLDGRLWFAGTLGVGWLDPAHLQRNQASPPVAIRLLTANGRAYAGIRPVELTSGTRALSIEYTALSLTRPEQTRFRYRLDGADSEWVAAGARRQAFYTNLAPGEYRFRVAAARANGAWSESGATLDVTIPPTFWQTKWFAALCVLAIGLLSGSLYALRVRQLTARVRGQLEVRLRERERIARELHDTLLQNMQGLILRLQTVAEEIPGSLAARRMMEETLDRADEVLIEGRDRVMDLRESQKPVTELPEALSAIGAQLMEESGVRFSMIVEGTPRPLHPIVREESCQIAREALINAFRHAAASKVEGEIAYSRRALCVRIRDNGRGIEAEVLAAGGRPGHWGLAGMRERADKLRARLNVWSGTNSGTEIELRVPGPLAYGRKQLNEG
ncbi:MAG TPA: two-component regulator propeller domain-containing protein [Steroidobacter sp.]